MSRTTGQILMPMILPPTVATRSYNPPKGGFFFAYVLPTPAQAGFFVFVVYQLPNKNLSFDTSDQEKRKLRVVGGSVPAQHNKLTQPPNNILLVYQLATDTSD